MRGVRGALPAPACAERSARIVARLESLDVVRDARTVALFWPMTARREVDVRALDTHLRSRGARIAYPAVSEAGEMTFRYVGDVEAMAPHPLGFREPPRDAPLVAPGDLDAVLLPALAVDPRGHRVGYGAGHYDRALASHGDAARRIAVVFDFQLLAEVPDTPGDIAAGVVVTDARTLVATPDAR